MGEENSVRKGYRDKNSEIRDRIKYSKLSREGKIPHGNPLSLIDFGVPEYELPREVNKYLDKYQNDTLNEQDKGEAIAIASNLLDMGIKNKDLGKAYIGAKLYELLGYGNRNSVINRLKKAQKLSEKSGKNDVLYYNIKAFFETNKGTSLEKSVLTSVFAGLAVAGLFFGFSSLTGAAIGFSKSFSLTGGVALFVVGILGLSFGRKL